MATSHKALLSFLISFVLVGVFAALAFTGLFDLLEARFHNPSIIASINRANARNAETIDSFFTETETLFSETLKTETVLQSFQDQQRSEDVSYRAQIYAALTESLRRVQWIRFIDPDGERILFSSHESDVQSQDGRILIYHDYHDTNFPYETVAVKEGEALKHTFDEKSGLILFSFPLYDSFDIYCGTALFAVPIDTVRERLFSEGRIRFSQDLSVISNPPGLLFETTLPAEIPLSAQVSSAWRDAARKVTGQNTSTLVTEASGASLFLFSAKSSHGFFIGRLVSEKIFLFPPVMRIILLAAFFITVFLVIFLLFSLRPDPVTVVQNRMKKLQVSLVEQFYELRGETDWARWVQELGYRRDEISAQLKKGVKTASEDKDAEIDILVKKSWEELLSVLGKRREEGIEEEKLKSILQRIFSGLTGTEVKIPKLSSGQPSGSLADEDAGKAGLLMRAAAIVKELEETDLVEELEELDEPGELETLEYEDGEETAGEDFSVGLSGEPDISGEDIAYLASKIEFGPDREEADFSGDEQIKDDVEIVSPFSSMMFDFSQSGEDDPGAKNSRRGKAGENGALDEGGTRSVAGSATNGVIEEKDGVHYISGEARTRGPETSVSLDRDFKDLVDSVIK